MSATNTSIAVPWIPYFPYIEWIVAAELAGERAFPGLPCTGQHDDRHGRERCGGQIGQGSIE